MNFTTTVVEDDVSRPNIRIEIENGMVNIELNRFKINETLLHKNTIVAGINKKLTELRNKLVIAGPLLFEKQQVEQIQSDVEEAITETLEELVSKEKDRNKKLKEGR